MWPTSIARVHSSITKSSLTHLKILLRASFSETASLNGLSISIPLNFNECLLILLGINPTLASLIEPKLYKTKLNDVGGLKENYLSLIFFQRVENHLLRERFRGNKINIDEFIKWAMDYKYLREVKI